MSEHEQGCSHAITLERIGDTVIVDIPANDTHYELTFSVAAAIRVGSALVRVATGEHDSLSNEQIEAAMTELEGGEQT